MLTTGEIAKHLSVGTHGTTYGGNPLASAVAEAALDVINTPEVLDGVKAKHERFKSRLQKIGQEYGIFDEIRGMGLLIGAALTDEWKGKARDVLNAAEKEAVMVLQASPDVVRFAPSLVIDDARSTKAGALRARRGQAGPRLSEPTGPRRRPGTRCDIPERPAPEPGTVPPCVARDLPCWTFETVAQEGAAVPRMDAAIIVV